MGNTSGNFKSDVDSVDIALDFEIDPNRGQDELRSFGYYFNAKGQCRSVETEERVGRFPSQKAYEDFGAALERYIFFLLREQYRMTEKIIESADTDADDAQDTKRKKRLDRANDDKIAKSRIYLSPDYGQKETLLLLIPGSGAVRAGQWARSICINDNLAAGCMYPYIAEAYSRDWGVVLFDPNGRTSTGRVFSDEHVSFVYDKWVERPFLSKADCAIKNVLIVCHSAGGMATTRLLNTKGKYLVPRIRGVAGTDTFFGKSNSTAVDNVYQRYVANWVTSSEALGTELGQTVPRRLSAGHSKHEYTSAAAYRQIFNFFDAHLKLHNDAQPVQDTDGQQQAAAAQEEKVDAVDEKEAAQKDADVADQSAAEKQVDAEAQSVAAAEKDTDADVGNGQDEASKAQSDKMEVDNE